MCNHLIIGHLATPNDAVSHTFWIDVRPALDHAILEFSTRKIESYLGVNF